MPCYRTVRPSIDYAKQIVTVDGTMLPLFKEENDGKIKVTNIAVKKFRSLLRENAKSPYEVYSVRIK